MIMPTKHTNFSQSLLGFGGYILAVLESPMTIDDLWYKYQIDYQRKVYFAKQSFDNLILTIVFLHSIGIVSEKNGIVQKCN
jgi:hypothetical protein